MEVYSLFFHKAQNLDFMLDEKILWFERLFLTLSFLWQRLILSAVQKCLKALQDYL